MTVIELFGQAVNTVQAALFETVVLPLLHAAGGLGYAEEAFDGIENLLYGALEIATLVILLGLLERLRPVETWPDRRDVRPDVVYTLLHRLGLFPLVFFFAVQPLFDRWQSMLHQNGWPTLNLERLLPALADNPLLAFAAYLVVIDFANYWIHRAQHRFEWWWALHSLHHSQRQMTFWTDDRNHLLDSLLTEGALAILALMIGVPPAQFVGLVVLTRLVESLSHANLRCGFGGVGERLLVSPRFHRVHHTISAGREGSHRGANFAVLFPVWDILFRTADLKSVPGPTGVDDQATGRDYGQGFWAQQWRGLQRLWAAVAPDRRSARIVVGPIDNT